MARPKKKNADYFPHDADMRNDPKIKSLRRKYGFKGYAVWVMILEVITDSDYFEYEWSELNIELISGDFDIEPEDLIDIIKYCVRIKLLVNDNGMLYTDKLKERFEGLLSRRKTDRKRKTEEFSTRKTPKEEIIRTEKPQSKVKESKVKESKIDDDVYISIDTHFKNYLANDKLIKAIIENNDLYKNKNHLEKGLIKFNKHLQNLDQTFKTWKDYTSHFLFWSRKEKLNNSTIKSPTDITL